MRLLGIETSCDETSVALLSAGEGPSAVMKELTASQVWRHREFGGVVPEVAARMHVEALPAILKEMGVGRDDVDAVAVTRGPGLVTSLRVGTDFARTLAYAWRKPLVGVNHIEGHIAANWIGKRVGCHPRDLSHVALAKWESGDPVPSDGPAAATARFANRRTLASDSGTLPLSSAGPSDAAQPFSFPAVALVVSGGHTELILVERFGSYRLLGATLDDAAGEAFDKVAKMLELGYPGGPEVSKRAVTGRPDAFTLPRPMLTAPNLDFSFSGLKTAVLRAVERKTSWSERDIDDLSASFQAAVVETLVAKTVRAARENGARTVFLAGGVSANRSLRETLKASVESQTDAVCVLPDLAYATDNAAMIAMAGYFRRAAGQSDDVFTLVPDPNWELGR